MGYSLLDFLSKMMEANNNVLMPCLNSGGPVVSAAHTEVMGVIAL